MKAKIKKERSVTAITGNVIRNKVTKVRKTIAYLMCAVLVLSCFCSCSKNTEPVGTTIVYVTPDGEVLDPSFVSRHSEWNIAEAGNFSAVETEGTTFTEETTTIDETTAIEETRPTEDEESNKNREIENAISEAEAFLSEGKIDDALVALIPVKKYSDPRVTAEEKRINSYRPVALFDLDPIMRTDADYLDTTRWQAGYELNTGECGHQGIGCTTTPVLTFYGYPGGTYKVTECSWTFFIGNNDYDTLSGLFALSGIEREHKNTEFSLSLEVYADEALIFTSEQLTKGSLPIDICVDIPTGTQMVTITFVTSTTNLPDGISVDEQYASCLVDAYFSKKYTPLT